MPPTLTTPGGGEGDEDIESGRGPSRGRSSGDQSLVAYQEDEEDYDDYDEEYDNPLQRIIAPLVGLCQLLVRSSYIATNIVMMVSDVRVFLLPFFFLTGISAL